MCSCQATPLRHFVRALLILSLFQAHPSLTISLQTPLHAKTRAVVSVEALASTAGLETVLKFAPPRILVQNLKCIDTSEKAKALSSRSSKSQRRIGYLRSGSVGFAKSFSAASRRRREGVGDLECLDTPVGLRGRGALEGHVLKKSDAASGCWVELRSNGGDPRWTDERLEDFLLRTLRCAGLRNCGVSLQVVSEERTQSASLEKNFGDGVEAFSNPRLPRLLFRRSQRVLKTLSTGSEAGIYDPQRRGSHLALRSSAFLGEIVLISTVVQRNLEEQLRREDEMHEADIALKNQFDKEDGVCRHLHRVVDLRRRMRLLLVKGLISLLGFPRETQSQVGMIRQSEEFVIRKTQTFGGGLEPFTAVGGLGIDIVSTQRFEKSLREMLSNDDDADSTAEQTDRAGEACRCSNMCRYTRRILSAVEAAEMRRRFPRLFARHWRRRAVFAKDDSTVAERIYEEASDSSAVSQGASFLAKRFAAKEAAAKALGRGLRCLSEEGLKLSDLETRSADNGAPFMLVRSPALSDHHLSVLMLSLSDEKGIAAASALAPSRC